MTQPQTILCPKCHKPGRRQARFCQHCGHDMILNNNGPRYYITRVVKAGGQGAVYEAVGDDDKVYAVKEMLDNFVDARERDAGIERFQAEAKMLERLSHPRIPRVYSHFEDEKRHYLAMDFIRGEDLEDILEREGAIPEQRVLDWADQICDVLGYLHDHGLIYRDMKPSNVMIDRQNGGIKLIDFGIAKVLQTGQRGTQIGTPGYAPPEQYQGLATVQSDIFALGATLHHLLTGRDPQDNPPFAFPAVRDVNPSVSERTSDAISRALQMKAADRFQTLAEFCDALGLRAAPQPAAAPSHPKPSAPATPARPKPAQPKPVRPKPAQPKPAPSTPPPAAVAARPAAPAQAATAAAPAPPMASPQRPARGLARGCFITTIIGVLIVLLIGYVVLNPSLITVISVPVNATPTAQTLVLQPFQTNVEIIIPTGGDTSDAALKSAFEYAFLELARNQYGPGVQLQPNSVVYVGGAAPERLGDDPQGTRYRASLNGFILVPQR